MEMARRSFMQAAALGLGTAAFVGTTQQAVGAPASASKGEVSEKQELDTWTEFDYEFDGVKTKKVTVECGGNKLVGTLQVPASVPEQSAPLVFLVHGAQGTRMSDMFQALGAGLPKRGYAAVRFDFHGHGDSEGDFATSTVETNLVDLEELITYAQANVPWAKSVSLIGHSVGGCEVTMYAGRNPDLLKAVVAIDPAYNLYDIHRGILAGTAERLDYMSDQWVEDAAQFDVFSQAPSYEGPLCIIHGRDDKAVGPEYAVQMCDLMPDADLHLLAHAPHTPAAYISEVAAIVGCFLDRYVR